MGGPRCYIYVKYESIFRYHQAKFLDTSIFEYKQWYKFTSSRFRYYANCLAYYNHFALDTDSKHYKCSVSQRAHSAQGLKHVTSNKQRLRLLFIQLQVRLRLTKSQVKQRRQTQSPESFKPICFGESFSRISCVLSQCQVPSDLRDLLDCRALAMVSTPHT